MVHMFDVTIRQVDVGYLEEGHKSKINKYSPLLPILAKKLSVEP
jgi:hypothetical protein